MTCSHMSYFFISKQLLWELFFRISNSKTSIYIHDPTKGTNITIPNNKMVLVSYSKITSSNISYTGFGIIVSRVRDELTGKLTEIQSVENISLSLEGNKLIASSESWFRIIVTVL